MYSSIDLDPSMLLLVIISAIGVVALLALGFVNVRFLFYAWVITLPFAQRSLFDLGSMNLYVDRIILVFLFLFSLAHVSMRKITLAKISVVELLMFGFSLVCLVSASTSNSLDRFGFGLLLAAYIFPFLGYYLAKSFIQNEADVRRFSTVITYLSLYLAYVGICEQVYPALVFPRYIVNPHYIISNVGRSVGPSLEPVGYGVGLIFCLLLSIYLFFRIGSLLRPAKLLALIAILMAPVAIFFTYTRAVWGGLALSLFSLCLFYPRGKRIFASLLLIMIIGFISIRTVQISRTEGSAEDVEQRDSISIRMSMAKTGMKMFLEKPIFGFGYLQAGKEFTPYFERVGTSFVPDQGLLIHNTFVNILVELGLIGFIPFVLILAYIIKDAIILYKRSVENRDIAVIFFAACGAFVFAAMANNMYYIFAHVLLFCMAGMVKGLLQAKPFPKKKIT